MSQFEWNPSRNEAAILLADGYTIRETAQKIGVSEKTIDRWKADIEFAEEVDRLSLMVGIASRAERLRLAKRVIRKMGVKTKKDLLEWIKFAQSETDGAKIDLATFDAFALPVADGQQTGTNASAADEESEKDHQ